MFQDYTELSGLLEVADLLATTSHWPTLYDVDVLAKNEVPVYCAIFIEDM